MKNKYLIIIVTILLFSCGKDKSVLLPEIENAKVTEVLDVSPAYIFYNETQPDSVELNRKNLIGTTNWLFNIDKRLTLEQTIPKIKFLQNKKRNAQMHKNENAKNYYTCNDTSIQNLGFIEFTDVVYEEMSAELNNDLSENSIQELHIYFKNEEEVYINDTKTNKSELINKLKERIIASSNALFHITLSIDRSNSFQNYITLKNSIVPFLNDFVTLNKNEFIY